MAGRIPSGSEWRIDNVSLNGSSTLKLSSSINYISANAFVGSEGELKEIVFEGNAPVVEKGAFDTLSPNCVVYVSPTSVGWGVDVPGKWNGRSIQYYGISGGKLVLAPRGWVDERSETAGQTGEWSSPVEYDGAGFAAINGDNTFDASAPSDRDIVTMTVKACFAGAMEDVYMTNLDQAGMQIGPTGCFQVYTISGGAKTWLDVSADGVTPDEAETYTVRFWFNYRTGVYSASVLSGGEYKPLKAGGMSQFPIANPSAKALSSVDFTGYGAVKSILGENACFAAGDRECVNTQAVLTASQAEWLNGLGDYETVRRRLSAIAADRLLKAHLLNLDIVSDDASPGYSFEVADFAVDDENVTVKVRLTRANPVTVGGVAQPINGELKIFGAEAIGDEFRDVHTCDGLAFDADGNATVTIPKSELNVRFFRPVISGGDE